MQVSYLLGSKMDMLFLQILTLVGLPMLSVAAKNNQYFLYIPL